MSDSIRQHLASRMVVVLPKYGLWANGFRDVVTPHGRVGYRQFIVLWMLHYEVLSADEVTATRLASFFDVQPSVMTRALAKLEVAGLIKRTVDIEDRRRSRIVITDTGRETCDYVQDVITRSLLTSMSFLTDEQVIELEKNVEVLDQIVNDLEQQGGMPGEEEWRLQA
jgi:DNA-binding MarR family transcriptional regulator